LNFDPKYLPKLQPLHTDYGEILSLYTLSRAATGGDFFLADIHDIVARIEKVRPDIIETLRDNWLMVKYATSFPFTFSSR